MQSLTHVSENATKSLLLYSADNLFIYTCKVRFKNIYQIDTTTSTSAAQTLIETNSYDIAVFDILYTGQCDNLIRYLSNANTHTIVIVTTQDQERYYASCQLKLGINQLFRKPIKAEYYDIIIKQIT